MIHAYIEYTCVYIHAMYSKERREKKEPNQNKRCKKATHVSAYGEKSHVKRERKNDGTFLQEITAYL